MAVFKDSVITMVGKTYKSVAALVFVMVISRVFTERSYGTYRQVMLIANTINLLLLLGVNETISYNYRIIDHKSRNQLVTNMVVFKFMTAIPIIISMAIFKNQIVQRMNNEDLADIMNILIILTLVFLLASIIENYYLGAGRAILLSKIQIGMYTIHYTIAVLIALFVRDIKILLIEITVFEFVNAILLFSVIFYLEKFKFDFNLSYLLELLKFSIPIGLSLIVITINQNVDQLMVSFFFSPSEYAIYNNGAMNIPIVQLLTITVGSVILPKLSQVSKEESFEKGLEIWREAATNTALVLITFMFLFFIFAEGYVTFIFSDKYIQSVPIMRVYLFRMFVTFTIYSSLLLVLNKKKMIVYIALVGLGVNIILNLLFIKLFGMIGPAISTVLVQFLVNILEVVFVIKYSGVKLTKIFEFVKLFKIVLTSGLISIVIKVMSEFFSLGAIWNFFIYGTIYVVLTYIAYFVTGQLDKNIISLVTDKLKLKKRSI